MHDGIGISQNGKSFVWNNKSLKQNRKTLVWLRKVFTSCDTGQRRATGTNYAGRPNSAAGSFFFFKITLSQSDILNGEGVGGTVYV